jgi:hypothetical protein
MRFIAPPQTFAEYKHRKMPVFETLGLSAGTMLAIGAGSAALGAAGSIGMGIYGATRKMPGAPNFSQNIPTPEQFAAAQQAQQQNALGFASEFSRMGTAENIANQNKVTPGSSQQRKLAQNQINQYIQGQIPQDVQQNIQRQVAQNLGGGFNAFSGGGQAPNAFARNIGQTSLGLSQFGLSAAPTWQQLANSMVVSPIAGAQIALQAGQVGNQQVLGAAGLGNQAMENQYQANMNQYGAQQAQIQGMAQGFGALGSAGAGLMNAGNMANYYGGLSQTGQGMQNTLGALPSTSTANSYMKDLGYSGAGSGFSALQNTGGGTAYPFGR